MKTNIKIIDKQRENDYNECVNQEDDSQERCDKW